MTYTYNINDFKNNKVNLPSLIDEILDKEIPLKQVFKQDQNVIILLKLEITQEQEIILNNVISNHTGNEFEFTEIEYVKIKEEEYVDKTNGHFQSQVIDVKITDHGVSYVDKVFPFNISLLSAEWLVDSSNIGDIAEFHLAPDTVIGVLTSDCVSGTSIFNVNDTVINNLDVGYYVKINNEDLGMVVSKDIENLTITTEKQSTINYSANDYILMTIKVVPYWKFTAAGRSTVGQNKIGASFIPANTILRLVYNNKNTIKNKLFGITIDYIY